MSYISEFDFYFVIGADWLDDFESRIEALRRRFSSSWRLFLASFCRCANNFAYSAACCLHAKLRLLFNASLCLFLCKKYFYFVRSTSKNFSKVLHVCIYLQSKGGNETLNFRCFRARWFAFSLNWSFHNESTYIIFLRQIKEFANFARSLRSQTPWNFLIS